MNTTPIRPRTVQLISKLMRPLVEEGVVGVEENKRVIANLRHLAQKSELLPTVEPKLLDQREVAAMLGIGISSFKKVEAQLGIPRKMVGKSVRYRKSDVAMFVAADEDGGAKDA